jgi:hypothetical protein
MFEATFISRFSFLAFLSLFLGCLPSGDTTDVACSLHLLYAFNLGMCQSPNEPQLTRLLSAHFVDYIIV